MIIIDNRFDLDTCYVRTLVNIKIINKLQNEIKFEYYEETWEIYDLICVGIDV